MKVSLPAPPSRTRRAFEEAATLRPDLARALRATIAFIGPLAAGLATGQSHAAAFAAPAALTLALTDLRGPYRERFAVALTMALAMTGATVLGIVVADSVPLSVVAMGIVALLGGGWRHLSADYGPGLTSATALLFLLALAVPGGLPAVRPLLEPLALGCGLAILLQMAAWFTRPQHPLRAAVADVWVATADLLRALQPEVLDTQSVAPGKARWWKRLSLRFGPTGFARPPDDITATAEGIARRERALRTALDQAIGVVGAAGNRHQSALLAHLTVLRQAGARLGAWAEAFHTALGPVRPAYGPAAEALFQSLATLARAVAVAIVSHRPRHFAAVVVRVQRSLHLARLLDDKLAAPLSPDPHTPTLRALLAQLTQHLPALRDELEATTDHGAATRSVLRRVPALRALSPRGLLAWVDFSPALDPVLVRHAMRMALLTMAAVAVYKIYAVPRGYWIALTILVVLQPDYGATRQRAGQRIGGTLAGAVVASGLLWLHLPPAAWLTLAAGTAFGFAYLVRTHYRWAVFFVTVMLVLVTEVATPVTLALPLMRIGATVVGGAVALLAALFLWPSWERARFPTVLAGALRANADYLRAVLAQLLAGRALVSSAVQAKRAAETANAQAGASLEKVLAEPGTRVADITQAGVLTAYAQRLTRAITLLAVQLQAGAPAPPDSLVLVAEAAAAALETLAAAIAAEETLAEAPPLLEPSELLPDATNRNALLAASLARAVTEIRALALAVSTPSHQ